jgi:WD40-like Beta Propeller Repeat
VRAVNCRVIVLVLAAFLVCLGTALPAAAATPEGPRLAISLGGDGPGAEDEFSEVITTGPAGEDPQPLLRGSGGAIGAGLSWAGDGSGFAFSAGGVESTADGPFGSGWPVVGLARLGGDAPQVYPSAFLNAGEPVLAPDGSFVVFQRVKLVKVLPDRESYLFKSSIWKLGVGDGSVKRLTRWRLAAFFEPSSFSADGSTLAAESSGYRVADGVVAIDLRRRRIARLARNASEPTFSPDGSKLAFVRDKTRRFQLPKPDRPVTELWVARADGSAARRVLRRSGYISSPSWDPSGSRLAFVRNPPADATGNLEPEGGNRAVAINADGTCLTRLFTDPALTLYDVAWRPGPGREAGPISC